MKHSMKYFVAAAIFLSASVVTVVDAQTAITNGTYVENFDSLGSGLPTNWAVTIGASSSALGASGATFASGATTWGTTTGNFRNVASALNSGAASADNTATQSGYTNRALGVRQTGSFGDPGAAFEFNISTLGVQISAISFSAQMLSIQGYSTTWTLQYGLGTNPTSFVNLATYSDPGVFGATTVVGTGMGTSLDNQSSVWLRVVALTAATGASSRDTFAIDNFSITAVPEPSTYVAIFGAISLVGAVVYRRRNAKGKMV